MAAWHPAWWLLPVLVFKGALALTMAAHPLVQPVGDLDSGEYWRLAARVAAGDLLLDGTPFYVSPLYVYVLALLQTLGGGTVTGVLVGQALLGTAAVGLVWQVVGRWSTRLAAMIAAATVALTGVLALQEASILQSALDPLLVAWFLLAFTRALQGGGVRWWLACGLAIALFALNRPNAWLLVALAVPAAVRWQGPATRSRALAALAVGAVLVLAPFTVRTGLATGAWQVLPTHGGLNVYIGNHAQATGTYTVVDGVRPSMAGQREDVPRVAAAAVGRTVSDGEASAYFLGEALDFWRTSPVAALRLTAYKAWLALHAWELPVNVSYAWFREESWLIRLLPVGAWLLLPLAAAALVVGPVGVREEHRGAWRWFRWCLPVYLASVVLVFVVDRYRAPALVMAAVVAAPFVGALLDARRTGVRSSRLANLGSVAPRRLVLAASVAVVLLAAALMPLPFHLGEGDADVRMALHAIEAGDDEAASGWLARAERRHPEPGIAWFRAGLAWQADGDWPASERALREARRHDPEVADVAFALAGSLLSQGRGGEAVSLLREAEAAGVRPDRVSLDLALALWQAGREDEARAALADGVPDAGMPLLRARALAAVDARQARLATWLLEAYRGDDPRDAEVAEKLGLMYAEQRRWQEAAAALEDAARLDAGRATARFNLALVRLQQGRRNEAIALLREALRIDPGYAQAAGALRELMQ